MLTVLFGAVMELSHRKIWSDWLPDTYAPHYSEVNFLSEDTIDKIELLNWIKTGVGCYVIIFGILLRISHYIVLPIVCLVGSPFILAHYCSHKRQLAGA